MPRLINGSPPQKLKYEPTKRFTLIGIVQKNGRLESTLHDYQLIFLIDL